MIYTSRLFQYRRKVNRREVGRRDSKGKINNERMEEKKAETARTRRK